MPDCGKNKTNNTSSRSCRGATVSGLSSCKLCACGADIISCWPSMTLAWSMHARGRGRQPTPHIFAHSYWCLWGADEWQFGRTGYWGHACHMLCGWNDTMQHTCSVSAMPRSSAAKVGIGKAAAQAPRLGWMSLLDTSNGSRTCSTGYLTTPTCSCTKC